MICIFVGGALNFIENIISKISVWENEKIDLQIFFNAFRKQYIIGVFMVTYKFG